MMPMDNWREEWIEPIVIRLKDGPASKQELAEVIGVTPERLTWMVETLVDYGLLDTDTDNGVLKYRLSTQEPDELSAYQMLGKLLRRIPS